MSHLMPVSVPSTLCKIHKGKDNTFSQLCLQCLTQSKQSKLFVKSVKKSQNVTYAGIFKDHHFKIRWEEGKKET